MIVNHLLAYLVYLLGAALFLLDLVGKYKKMADSNPDTSILFNARVFWKKESINIIKILLWGVATPILLIPLTGISVDFKNATGEVMFNTSIKVVLMPLYFILGYSGGRAQIAVAGQYKKTFYEKLGITKEAEKETE